MPEADELPPRELMEYDVVIVGAGPAGLAAAIRLKQREASRSVVIVEKGSAVGAHILSGAVIDPIGLDRLIPDWRADPECPLKTQVSEDRFYYLSETRSRAPAELADAAAHGQPRQFRRLARGAHPLARRAGGSPRRRNLSRLRGDRAPLRREGRGRRRRDRRHGDRPGRQAEAELHPRHGAEGEIRPARGGRARLAGEGGDRPLQARPGELAAEISASASRSCGRFRPRNSRPASSSTPSAGRSQAGRPADPSSIITTTGGFRSDSSSISATIIPISRRSTSSSGSRPIR